MSSELKPVRRTLGLSPFPFAGRRCYSGSYKGVGVIAAVTNMGLAAAEEATEALLTQPDADIGHLFVVGIAGGQDPRLGIGELVVPEYVVDHRDGVFRRPVNLGARKPSGVIYSSDSLRYDSEYVAMLERNNVSAVDMESGAVAAVCDRHQCPVTVIRAISDRVDHDAESYDVFHLANADGSPRPLAALSYVLKRPTRIPYLMAMARGAGKAIEAASGELLRNMDALLAR